MLVLLGTTVLQVLELVTAWLLLLLLLLLQLQLPSSPDRRTTMSLAQHTTAMSLAQQTTAKSLAQHTTTTLWHTDQQKRQRIVRPPNLDHNCSMYVQPQC